MQIPYLWELFTQVCAILLEMILLDLMWSQYQTVAPIENKFREATLTGDFSAITQEDKDLMRSSLLSIANIWKGIVIFAGMYMAFPIQIINKYVFCKLTERPFVWLSTYTFDLITLGLYLYVFGFHIAWLDVKNEGYSLEEVPSQDLMYI